MQGVDSKFKGAFHAEGDPLHDPAINRRIMFDPDGDQDKMAKILEEEFLELDQQETARKAQETLGK